MKIAWIGTGVMGKAMAMHLHDAGHLLHVYNRTYEKAIDLKTKGIQVCKSIAECVQDVDVVFTMVGYPRDVYEVYCSQDGIFTHVKKGSMLIDMTTSSPALAKQLYDKACQAGLFMLDAPVSGGDSGARDASLTIMVGGDEEVYQQAVPLLSCLGKSLHYMGKAGCGQHTKACNQIAVAGAVAAMSEAMVYAQKEGLDMNAMLNAISKGAAGSWQMDHTAPRVLQKDFAPGFYNKHFIKDMHIVKTEMQKKGIDLKMLDSVCSMYEALADDGKANLGTQALLYYYEKSDVHF